jgi:hypothetical protein
LLNNTLADKLPWAVSDSKVASVLRQAQMEWIQSLTDPDNEDLSDQDPLLDKEEDLWDTPRLAADNTQHDAINLEEEIMFEHVMPWVNNNCPPG